MSIKSKYSDEERELLIKEAPIQSQSSEENTQEDLSVYVAPRYFNYEPGKCAKLINNDRHWVSMPTSIRVQVKDTLLHHLSQLKNSYSASKFVSEAILEKIYRQQLECKQNYLILHSNKSDKSE